MIGRCVAFLHLLSLAALWPTAAQSTEFLVIRTAQVGVAGPVGREIRVSRGGTWRTKGIGLGDQPSASGTLAPGTVAHVLETLAERNFQTLPEDTTIWTQPNPAIAEITFQGETRRLADVPRGGSDAGLVGDELATARRRFREILTAVLRELEAGGLRRE